MRNKRSQLLQLLSVGIGVYFAIGVSLYFLGKFANGFVRSGLDRMLPYINAQGEYSVSVKDINYSLLSGLTISDVIIANKSKTSSLLVKAPRLKIEMGLSFHPLPGLEVKKISLYHPEILFSSEFAYRKKEIVDSGKGEERLKSVFTSFMEYLSLKFEGINAKLKRVRFANRFQIGVDQADAEILIHKGSKEDNSFSLILNKLTGFADIDLDGLKVSMEMQSGINGGKRFVFVSGNAGDKGVEIDLNGKDLKMSSFSKYLPQVFSAGDDSKFDVGMKLKSDLTEDVALMTYKIVFNDMDFDDESLSEDEIDDVELILKGNLKYDGNKKEFIVTNSNIRMEDAVLNMEGSYNLTDRRLKLELKMSNTPIQEIINSLPYGFISRIYGAEVSGDIDMDVNLLLDLKNITRSELDPSINVEEFEVVEYPKSIDIKKLKGPFTHVVRKKGKVVEKILVSPKNPNFVPFDKLTETVKKGVLTCEDGSFFSHKGFQPNRIEESLIQNIQKKSFVRGASTITMQLAKNLYLNGKKNLSRKFQEMLIAYALEQELSKKRILEIYMNIIEWGPDIYGIKRAAEHYFSKKPEEITPLEAAFLGSIIASPIRYHRMYRDGSVTDQWATYLALILKKMHVTEEEFEASAPFQPEFNWVKKEREAMEALSQENKVEE
ncbi:MAG: biosynthetic peptidoglycan transglycosylase [Pseudomonadota bacterium]